jgi:hypothetical protein
MSNGEGDSGLYERVPAWERWVPHRPFGERVMDWLLGRRVPLPSYMGVIEDPPSDGKPRKTGICCSGGGIRSAAFNLGALQALQAGNRLQESKYLAAVSGGSYIAAAFSMVAKTSPANAVGSDDSDPTLFTSDRPPFYHGSPEEQYLRNRSSYMAPGGTGKARLILRIALGLLVNLLFFAAGLVLIAWLLATYYRHFHGSMGTHQGSAAAGTRDVELEVAGGVAVFALLLGLLSLLLGVRADLARRGFETAAMWGVALAALIVVVTVGLPELIAFLRHQGIGDTAREAAGKTAQGSVAGAAGGTFGALLGAVLLELRPKGSIEKATTWYRKLAAPLRQAVARIATWLVGPLVLIAGLVFVVLAMVTAHHVSLMIVVGVAVIFVVFWLWGDVTAWSLHPFYRRRLCTAFALKRVRTEEPDPREIGKAVERQYDKLVPLSMSGVEPGPGPGKTWPTLVVCAAANVSDHGATPPGRAVTSFTFSPAAMGGPLVGGIPTAAFENHIIPSARSNFTLAAAVAMSGAAVSPSMGKETRRSIRFLLGLANVRLGVWVPNPRRTDRWLESSRGVRSQVHRFHPVKRGRITIPLPRQADEDSPPGTPEFRKSFLVPRPGPWYLLKEMCGWNSVNDPFLYVTDGGHYENLGLVELLRRGCTEIFCFDASGGRRLDALGDAIALARSELNVEIEDLDPAPLAEDGARLAKRCCVSGRIRYPGGATGILVYARNVVTKRAPYDVQAFRIRDEVFPHHSTLDQLYTDEKFEAYRELGAHAGRAALDEAARAG